MRLNGWIEEFGLDWDRFIFYLDTQFSFFQAFPLWVASIYTQF
jgi:hypothetical protein